MNFDRRSPREVKASSMATRLEHPTTGRINQPGVPDLIEEICGFMED